jgi:hypothetical protein
MVEQQSTNLSISIGNCLGNEDPFVAAPRVPIADSPPSRIDQLSKACSTSSALIGKRKGLSLPMDTIPQGGIS